MKFPPLTELEIQTSSLLPEGSYDYLVVKADEKVSRAGNDYLALTLKVWDKEGKEHTVFTNLALTKLIKHFCDVNEMQEQYSTGTLTDNDCHNKSGGNVLLGIEPEKANPNGGMYRAKNVVLDYVVGEPKCKSSSPLSADKDIFEDDSLPF